MMNHKLTPEVSLRKLFVVFEFKAPTNRMNTCNDSNVNEWKCQSLTIFI